MCEERKRGGGKGDKEGGRVDVVRRKGIFKGERRAGGREKGK